MFNKAGLTLGSLALIGFSGCAHINSVSLTPIPSNRSKVVTSEVSKVLILGLSGDNDYIDPLVSDLKRQCPNGVVSGILTKDESIWYFLAVKKRVTATGFCNASVSSRTKSDRSTASEGGEN